MSWPSWWPWSRHRRPSPEVQKATDKIVEAANDKAEASKVLREAQEISEWARQAGFNNRFDLRLEAAWRAKLRGGR